MRSGYLVVFVELFCALVGLEALLSCAPSAQAPVVAAAAPARVGAKALAVAAPTARDATCRAMPATIYGEEKARFELALEGSSAAKASLEARLFDEATGQIVYSSPISLPTALEIPGLSSGDFTLTLGDPHLSRPRARASCTITVNRELSRATSPARGPAPPR